jgi:hypothetical protein
MRYGSQAFSIDFFKDLIELRIILLNIPFFDELYAYIEGIDEFGLGHKFIFFAEVTVFE